MPGLKNEWNYEGPYYSMEEICTLLRRILW